MNPPQTELRFLNGALLVDKPADMTSFDVVAKLRSTLGRRFNLSRKKLPKIGHGGTLDPFATGLLVLFFGQASKLSRYHLGSDKIYDGTIEFGVTTESGDLTNEISERTNTLPQSGDELQTAAHGFVDTEYLQTPPMHSAKKVDGKRLYELAHEGKSIERDAVPVHIKDFVIKLVSENQATFQAHCSSGTYVRTLVQDLAKRVGSLGALSQLKRVSSGDFHIDHAVSFEAAKELLGDSDLADLANNRAWVPFDRVLDGFSHAEASAQETQELIQGRQSALMNLSRRRAQPTQGDTFANGDRFAIFHSKRLVAVAAKSGRWQLERVFPQPSLSS